MDPVIAIPVLWNTDSIVVVQSFPHAFPTTRVSCIGRWIFLSPSHQGSLKAILFLVFWLLNHCMSWAGPIFRAVRLGTSSSELFLNPVFRLIILNSGRTRIAFIL